MRRRETQTECNNERQSILLSHEYDMLKHKEHLGGIDASTSSSSPAPTLRFFPPPMNRTPLDRVGDPAPSDEVVAAFCFRVTLTNRTEGGSHTPTTTLCHTHTQPARQIQARTKCKLSEENVHTPRWHTSGRCSIQPDNREVYPLQCWNGGRSDKEYSHW